MGTLVGCLGPDPGGRLGGLAGGGVQAQAQWGVCPEGCPGPHQGSRPTTGGPGPGERGVSQHALR